MMGLFKISRDRKVRKEKYINQSSFLVRLHYIDHKMLYLLSFAPLKIMEDLLLRDD